MNCAGKTCATETASSKFTAALEFLAYLILVAAASFCFLMREISSNQAGILTLVMLVALIGLAWKRFDGGRHPCFLFLGMLTLFQAGRVIAYCAGGVTDIFQITSIASHPFDVSRDALGLVLLSVALSAICIYAPCRWNYRSTSSPRGGTFEPLLPYLYLLLALSMPVQLYKNFGYYEYAQAHGGYLVLFLDHGGMAASVPMVVRAVSLISLPAFVGIFILENRKKFRRLATGAYFLVTAPVLLTGSRGTIFCLILTLSYVAKVKSGKRARLHSIAFFAAGIILLASLIGSLRAVSAESGALDAPSAFFANQGASLVVTEIAVAYRPRFAPSFASYLANELEAAFVAGDQAHYIPGKRFSDDVSMFLNSSAYQMGQGCGSAYLAEAYLAGGLFGVVLISALLGLLLHEMHAHSGQPFQLFLVAMVLPDVLWMARGGLLDWLSVSVRVGISALLLLIGWHIYRLAASLGKLWMQSLNLHEAALHKA